MISLDDQNNLFELIADKIEKDLECYAFGGTAMMYYGIKNATKDIDLVFKKDNDRNIFLKAISKLGYKEKNMLRGIYSKEKSKIKTAPLMYLRNNDERFDLFSEKIFKTKLSKNIIDRSVEIRDFNAKKLVRVKILSKEDLVLLKSITSREKDFEDIVAILKDNPDLNWNIVCNEAVSQAKEGDNFIILDLEETMQKLKSDFFIKQKYFEILYKYI